MKARLLDFLACPRCGGDLRCPQLDQDPGRDVQMGDLSCVACPAHFPILRGIPRFVPDESYAGSFGFQWNLFRKEQLDSLNGADHSRRRFIAETGLAVDSLSQLSLMEVGCGAGRFLEVVGPLAKEVVGVDISSAIDAAAVTVAGRANVHLVQASVYELPFKPGVFDLCYSIGVIQHTPQPSLAVESLPRVVKDSGRLVLTIYERKPWTYLNAKYLVRPLTKRMNQKLLLQMIYAVAPILFPMTDVLYRLPLLNRFFAFVIPFADYTMVPGLSFAQRYRAAVLDTFDMLSPSYDQPQTMTEVSGAMSRGGIKSVRRMPAPGLTVVGTKS